MLNLAQGLDLDVLQVLQLPQQTELQQREEAAAWFPPVQSPHK